MKTKLEEVVESTNNKDEYGESSEKLKCLVRHLILNIVGIINILIPK